METTGGVFRTTFEELSLPHGENMGLAGGTFLYGAGDGFSVGPGVYGSLTGERGGFITLGLAGELIKELSDRIAVNGGLFVGAGGGHGGYELSGGGLMLRPHAGITVSLGRRADIGIGVSYVDFPDGGIRSTQPYVAVELPFEMLIQRGWTDAALSAGTTTAPVPASEREITLGYRRYVIPSHVRTSSVDDQHGAIGLVGARWDDYVQGNLFLTIESQGAMEGESNGFMQVFLGGGYRFDLGERTHLKLSIGAGAGGGGGVDTGGGLLLDGAITFQQYLNDSIFLAASGGYVNAPDGSFEALTAGLAVGTRYGVPKIRRGGYEPAALADYDRKRFRIRTAHQTYLNGGGNWRVHHRDENVDNLGFQLDFFPTRTLYLTGQGFAAYGRGNAGAYMEGLLGAGIHHPIGDTRVFLDLEALAGAAGGGGLAVGGGLVWQANAGLGIDLTDAFSLVASLGRIDAPGGDLEATVVGAAVCFRFSMFAKKL